MKVGNFLESYLVFGNLHEHICLNRYGKFKLFFSSKYSDFSHWIILLLNDSKLGFTFTFNKVQPKEQPQMCKKIHMFGSKM